MIKVGDKVKPNWNVLKNKDWYENVRHLTGEYSVVGVDGSSIIFYTGENLRPHPSTPGKQKGCRCWNSCNLQRVKWHDCLENK